MPELSDQTTGAGKKSAGLSEWRPLTTTQLAIVSGVVVFLLLVFPRFAPVNVYAALLVTTLLFWATHVYSHGAFTNSFAGDLVHPITLASAGFGLWSLFACAWSADIFSGFIKVLLYSGLVLVFFSARLVINQLSRSQLQALGFGLIAGLLIGSIYLCIETLTSRGITRLLFEHFESLRPDDPKHIRIHHGHVTMVSDANINRVTAVFSMMLWPGLLVTAALLKGKLRVLVLAILTVAALIILVKSRHQTSQIAIFAGGLLFVLALVAPWTARQFAIGGWIIASALMLPLAITAYNSGLHQSDWLFRTAQQRVIIWGYTAQQAFQRPIIGVGTNATPSLDEQRKVKIKPDGHSTALETKAHPHNVYLQVWYELGAIGAFLFGLIGLAFIEATASLSWRASAIALAQFATIAAMIGSSYGLWQTWFQASIVFSLLALILASRLAADDAPMPA